MFRILRIIFQLLPEPAHMHVDCPRRNVGAVLPDVAQKLLPCDDPFRVARQVLQEPQFFARETHATPGFPYVGEVFIPNTVRGPDLSPAPAKQ